MIQPSLQRRPSLARRAVRRAGFTLIELLAVILIIGILATFLLPKIPEAIDQARVTACGQNLREIYKGLLSYQIKFRRLPKKENSGVRFFAILIASETWENTPQSAEKLTCPGVDVGALTIGDLPGDEWFSELEMVDGSYSSYAGRDTMSHPLKKLSGKDVLIADDNDGGMNHASTTNVLYGDGAVRGIELYTLREDGTIDEEEEVLYVGPDSPMEALQVLSLD